MAWNKLLTYFVSGLRFIDQKCVLLFYAKKARVETFPIRKGLNSSSRSSLIMKWTFTGPRSPPLMISSQILMGKSDLFLQNADKWPSHSCIEVSDWNQNPTMRLGLSAKYWNVLVLSFRRIKFREKEVALFYLRAGYDPSCYECRNCSSLADANKMTEKSWENRLQIEKSRAIKSPSIEYHLLTNKLFQGIMQ